MGLHGVDRCARRGIVDVGDTRQIAHQIFVKFGEHFRVALTRVFGDNLHRHITLRLYVRERFDLLSKTNDPEKVLELSKEIEKGVRQVRIRITDPEADHYPFIFKKGQIVQRIDHPETRGEVVDGLYEGMARPGGSYSLIYTVKRLTDGILL